MSSAHVRHGFGAVRPYIYGPGSVWTLMRDAFGAVELERHAFSNKAFHVEARIGDSAIVLEAADPPHPGGRPSAIYVYVADVDAVYAKALSLGAQSINAPADKPYHERAAALRDGFGNTWYVSTYTGGGKL
jgi:PhnB protein